MLFIINLTTNESLIDAINFAQSKGLSFQINDGSTATATKTATPKKQAKLHVESEPWTPAPMTGKKIWQEDFITVTDNNGEYRVYLTIPKGSNPGAQKKLNDVRDFLKDQIKRDFKAVWAGNFDTHDIYWTFPSKSACEKYIKARKAYNEAHKKEGA